MMGRVLEIALELFGAIALGWSIRATRKRRAGACGPNACDRIRPRHLGAFEATFRHPRKRATCRPRCWPRLAPSFSSQTRTIRAPASCTVASASSLIWPWRSAPRPGTPTVSDCINARMRAPGALDDRRLFETISRRLEDALISLHAHGELRERESQLPPSPNNPRHRLGQGPCRALFALQPAVRTRVRSRRTRSLGKTDHDFIPLALADRFRAGDQQAIETGEDHVGNFETSRRGRRQGCSRCSRRRCATKPASRPAWSGSPATSPTDAGRTRSLRIAATAFEAQEGIVILDADQGSCGSITPSPK